MRGVFPKSLEMSSYHDHKVALVVTCYIATVSNHLWEQHLSAVHVQTLFFWAFFLLFTLSLSAVFDCGIAASPWCSPKGGGVTSPPQPVFLISHLGPDMFNRVHICFLTQWVVVPLLPLHLFFCTKNGTNSKVTKWRCEHVLRKKVLAKRNDDLCSISTLCCAVQWKDGKKPWDDWEGSVKHVLNTQHVSFMSIVLLAWLMLLGLCF